MRTLYVVTHPEATHHVQELVGGWYDSELTTTVLQAAERISAALAVRLSHVEPPVEVFSSDLRRTAQTAETICRHLAVPPVFDARLREKSYGAAEGKPQTWLDARFRIPPAHGERLRHDEGIDGPALSFPRWGTLRQDRHVGFIAEPDGRHALFFPSSVSSS